MSVSFKRLSTFKTYLQGRTLVAAGGDGESGEKGALCKGKSIECLVNEFH